MTELSISIVLYDTPAEVATRTINQLSTAVLNAQTEKLLSHTILTVINNGKDLEVVKEIVRDASTEGLSIKIFQNAENVGYGTAHNESILKETSDYHLILNPDVFLSDDALSLAINHLQSHPDVMMVTPYGLNADNEPLHLAKRYPSLLILALRGFSNNPGNHWFTNRLARYEYRDTEFREPTRVRLASGCCMLCRTSVLQSLQGFDERFFLYFEDYDLSLRIGQVGKIVCLPQMKIVHEGGEAARKGMKHILMFSRSAIRFFNRWGWHIF